MSCYSHFITEYLLSFILNWLDPLLKTQNHTMIEVGRNLWMSSGPTLLLKRRCLEQVAQDHVQTTFEYLQGWRLHNLPGQSVSVLGHPHSEKAFPDVQREPPVFQFVPIASGPVTGRPGISRMFSRKWFSLIDCKTPDFCVHKAWDGWLDKILTRLLTKPNI